MSETTTTAPLTVVLVHGAFADASSWNGVIERLHQQGLHRHRPSQSGGSHVIMISQPQTVTDVIVKAVRLLAAETPV